MEQHVKITFGERSRVISFISPYAMNVKTHAYTIGRRAKILPMTYYALETNIHMTVQPRHQAETDVRRIRASIPIS